LEIEQAELELLEILGVDILGERNILIERVEAEAIEIHRKRRLNQEC
jgi:hypothetical protein